MKTIAMFKQNHCGLMTVQEVTITHKYAIILHTQQISLLIRQWIAGWMLFY